MEARTQTCRTPRAGATPVKVMFVHNARVWGGGEICTMERAEYLRANGDLVMFVVRSQSPIARQVRTQGFKMWEVDWGDEAERWRGVNVYLSGPKRDMGLLQGVLRHLAGTGVPDCVHFQTIGEQLWGPSVATAAGARAVWTQHTMVPGYLANGPLRWSFRRSAHRTAGVIAVSHAVKRSLVECGVSPELVRVVQNGVAPSWDRASRWMEARQKLMERYGFGSGDLLLGTASRLHVAKGHLDVVQAMALVVRRVPTARLVLLGDGGLRPDIEELVKRLRLTRNVCMLGQRDDVRDVIAALDIYISASHSEGFPLSVLEALAEGVPAILRDLPAHRELAENAALFVSGGHDQWARAITEMAADKELRQSLSDAGIRRADALSLLSANEGTRELLLKWTRTSRGL